MAFSDNSYRALCAFDEPIDWNSLLNRKECKICYEKRLSTSFAKHVKTLSAPNADEKFPHALFAGLNIV